MAKQPKLFSRETVTKLSKMQKDLETIFEAVKDGGPKWLDECSTETRASLTTIDFIAGLKEEVEARADGRPRPLDVSELSSDSYDKRWAECFSPGYAIEAKIGDLDFRRKELVQLKIWIDQVIKFHDEQKPKASKVDKKDPNG
ncbi:MAG: hypothetical protein A4S09_02225 [Proteobacteria bacterium SG_bin7]|nr:MAG: hypothetical protein A4S09_02225 [Proteobacteria bacterium SG_bin7]